MAYIPFLYNYQILRLLAIISKTNEILGFGSQESKNIKIRGNDFVEHSILCILRFSIACYFKTAHFGTEHLPFFTKNGKKWRH